MTEPDRFLGYSQPFSPSGRAALLPIPPYHTGRTAIAFHFKADPERIARFIPDPLVPGETAGEAFLLFLDHMMPGGVGEGSGQVNKDLDESRMSFREVMLGIPCELDGVPANLVAQTWVNRDWAVIMGWLWGSPGRLADIRMTRHQADNEFIGEPKPGQTLRVQIERYGELVVRGSIDLDREGSADEPFFKTTRREKENQRYSISYRYLPDLTDPAGAPLLHQLATERHSSTSVGAIHSGPATLEFGGSATEELAELGDIELIGGHIFSGGFTSTGLDVLHDYLAALGETGDGADE